MAPNLFNILFANLALCAALSQPASMEKPSNGTENGPVKINSKSSSSTKPVEKEKNAPDDTVIVKLTNGKKMILITGSNGQVGDFKQFDLNAIVNRIDSIKIPANASAEMSSADTVVRMFVRKYNGEQPASAGKGSNFDDAEITIKSDGKQIKPGKNTTVYTFDASVYDIEIDSSKGSSNKVVTIYKGKRGRSVTTIKKTDGDIQTIIRSTKPRPRTTQRLDLNLGLNFYTEDGNLVDANAPYTLSPLGSRYFSIRGLQQTRLGGKDSKHHILYGLEVAWNNYMYDKDLRIEKNNDVVEWNAAPTGNPAYNKSKLTVCNLNVPVMYYFEQKDGWRGGVGFYGGYRLASYSKVRFNNDGGRERERQHNNFNLNDFQYGVRAQVGFREVDVFVNYTLSPVFRDNQGLPNLNTWTFGIEF